MASLTIGKSGGWALSCSPSRQDRRWLRAEDAYGVFERCEVNFILPNFADFGRSVLDLSPLDRLGRDYRWPETPSLDRRVWAEIPMPGGVPMTFTKRLEKLQALLQARSDVGPVYCRRMEDEDEADALERLVSAGTVLEPDRDRVVFIVRAIIDPPERPAEQLPALTTSPSPRTVQGTRMAEPEIRRQLTYPPLGIA